MTLFNNKYRTESARLRSWDYSSNAPYFVTICTANGEHHFGRIVNDKMQLSELGVAAKNCWAAIPEHFPFVVLGAYTIMPNHVHGIIIINKPIAVETQYFASLHNPEPSSQNHSFQHDLPALKSNSQTGNQFGPQSKNLGSIIRGYKIGVTKHAKQNKIDFIWQSRFHDHIIRDDNEYRKIHKYIVTNPQNWINDMFNK